MSFNLSHIVSFLNDNLLFISVVVTILGLMVGSFLNVLLYRLPQIEKKENLQTIYAYFKEIALPTSKELEDEKDKMEKQNLSLCFPSSHCPCCSNKLKWWHNIPVISYLILRGKCYFCSVKISAQYPVVEFLTAIVWGGSFYLLMSKYHSAAGLCLFLFFILTWVMILTDYKSYTIPDGLNFGTLWLGLIAAAFAVSSISATQAIFGAAVGYLSLFSISRIGKAIKGIDVMGEGDLKLIAAIGAFLGPWSIFFVVTMSTFIGIFTWVVFKFIHKDKETIENNALPYGPALILASWIYVFYSKQIHAYFLI